MHIDTDSWHVRTIGRIQGLLMMMKVRLFMIAFKNYSRLGACMHTANHPEGGTPRDH